MIRSKACTCSENCHQCRIVLMNILICSFLILIALGLTGCEKKEPVPPNTTESPRAPSGSTPSKQLIFERTYS